MHPKTEFDMTIAKAPLILAVGRQQKYMWSLLSTV